MSDIRSSRYFVEENVLIFETFSFITKNDHFQSLNSPKVSSKPLIKKEW